MDTQRDRIHMADEEQIPLHRRLGLRFLQLLIIIVAFMLIRNCIIISLNRHKADVKMQRQYYEKGYETGKEKALYDRQQAEQYFPDPLLERKYREGFRDGWDDTRQESKFQE